MIEDAIVYYFKAFDTTLDVDLRERLIDFTSFYLS